MILDGRRLVTVLPLAELYEKYHDHKRLKVFVHKGRECVSCDRVGVLLLITEELTPPRTLHVDLYTEDFVLMTVDHTIPKKMKGQGISGTYIESLENKQPMCGPCNWWKSDKQLTPDQIRELRKNINHKRTGPELIRKFVKNNNIFDRNLPESIALR